MLPTEAECRKIAERALSYAKVADASVWLEFVVAGNTRFANNEITTAASSESVNVILSATRDGRTGRVSLNETSADALERAMRRAEEIASVVPADPEYVGPLEKQEYLKIPAWDDATAKLDAGARLPAVREVVEPSARESLNASGFFNHSGRVQSLANKAGNFGWHRSTACSYSATVRTPDGTGSGWAEDSAWRASEVDAKELATRALQKARDSRQPRPLDPGNYTVILEPAAVAQFLQAGVGFQALSARAAEEGRSYFSKKGGGTRIGEKLAHESVTLKSDPTDLRRPVAPWAGVGGGGGGGGGGFGGGGADLGVAVRPVVWIKDGVLENLWYDRYWAKKAGRAPTGPPAALVLEGGKESMESLIASTERGLLITNFWYIRSVNPQTLQLTGLTRDGVWLIEKGKIAGAVSNFRFNESPAAMLQNVLGMTPAVRAGNSVVPAIKAADFTFTSLSDAV
ncbi:MAG: TldD/PmbA family protein [Candidatus Eiseniibacteriota bacterium]